MPKSPDDYARAHLDPFSSYVGELAASFYRESGAERWGLTPPQFSSGLIRSLAKRFGDSAVPQTPIPKAQCQEYLKTLHLEDFALACACLEGSESAWEFFVRDYRGYLRAAAGAITKGSRAGCDAQELADSLFADLFGLADGKRGERSLFRYFHGRSSLKTWLRAILAQRHIDKIRESRRWESIDDGPDSRLDHEADGHKLELPEKTATLTLDPRREEYLSRFSVALKICLEALPSDDNRRLRLYYSQGKKLAEIGRSLGEHESSVSRSLDRIRKELRASVEQLLRTTPPAPMSDAQILLCFQYAAEDVRIDFRQLFPTENTGKASPSGKESL